MRENFEKDSFGNDESRQINQQDSLRVAGRQLNVTLMLNFDLQL